MRLQLLFIAFQGVFLGVSGFRGQQMQAVRGILRAPPLRTPPFKGITSNPLAPLCAEAKQGIGKEGCQILAPSGINKLIVEEQQAEVYKAMAGMASLAGVLLILFSFGHVGVWPWGALLGPIFMLAGYSHFVLNEDYANIYPPKGTWGLWELPGSAELHVWWTGIAEIALGGSLFLGVTYRVFTNNPSMQQSSALALFLLTMAVTPANIYMYTHGARLPMNQPSPPVIFHYVRFALQSLLLASLVTMATS